MIFNRAAFTNAVQNIIFIPERDVVFLTTARKYQLWPVTDLTGKRTALLASRGYRPAIGVG